MGASNQKYIASSQDRVERGIKRGLGLKEIQDLEEFENEEEILQLRFEPNNWNIVHMSCWYGNLRLLKDLFKSSKFREEMIDEPDYNGEPPVVIACVLDDLKILKFLVETTKCKTKFDENPAGYLENLSLNTVCITHDSINCFLYLNPDLTSEEQALDVLYDLAKHKNSENIVKAFEKDVLEWDFDDRIFAENEPGLAN